MKEGRRLDWLRKYTMMLPELGPNALRLLSTVITATGCATVVLLATGIATVIGRGFTGHWLWNEIQKDRAKHGLSFMQAAYLEILQQHLHLAIFIICCILGLLIGRKLGWIISRNVLYPAPTSLAVVICALWGIGTAYGFRLMVTDLHPNIILAIIGFMAGGYISIPNYGLWAESTIPERVSTRHTIVSNLPLLVYIVTSILFYFTIR